MGISTGQDAGGDPGPQAGPGLFAAAAGQVQDVLLDEEPELLQRQHAMSQIAEDRVRMQAHPRPDRPDRGVRRTATALRRLPTRPSASLIIVAELLLPMPQPVRL